VTPALSAHQPASAARSFCRLGRVQYMGYLLRQARPGQRQQRAFLLINKASCSCDKRKLAPRGTGPPAPMSCRSWTTEEQLSSPRGCD
jgi:hypothetical protein